MARTWSGVEISIECSDFRSRGSVTPSDGSFDMSRSRFDAVAVMLEQGAPATDWQIRGPRLVYPSAAPEVMSEVVTVNLQPDVARAVLLYLRDIAEL